MTIDQIKSAIRFTEKDAHGIPYSDHKNRIEIIGTLSIACSRFVRTNEKAQLIGLAKDDITQGILRALYQDQQQEISRAIDTLAGNPITISWEGVNKLMALVKYSPPQE